MLVLIKLKLLEYYKLQVISPLLTAPRSCTTSSITAKILCSTVSVNSVVFSSIIISVSVPPMLFLVAVPWWNELDVQGDIINSAALLALASWIPVCV
jgi:hypothetical protein